MSHQDDRDQLAAHRFGHAPTPSTPSIPAPRVDSEAKRAYEIFRIASAPPGAPVWDDLGAHSVACWITATRIVLGDER